MDGATNGGSELGCSGSCALSGLARSAMFGNCSESKRISYGPTSVHIPDPGTLSRDQRSCESPVPEVLGVGRALLSDVQLTSRNGSPEVKENREREAMRRSVEWRLCKTHLQLEP